MNLYVLVVSAKKILNNKMSMMNKVTYGVFSSKEEALGVCTIWGRTIAPSSEGWENVLPDVLLIPDNADCNNYVVRIDIQEK